MPARQESPLFTDAPERERMREEPIVRFARTERVRDVGTGEEREVEKKYVSILGVELEVYHGPDGSIFRDEEFADFSLDAASLDLLKRYALAIKLGQSILVEGETDIGKTRALEYLAHVTNHRLYRLSMSGQTDVTEFIGKYVPNTEDARLTFERVLRGRERLSKASRAILEQADEQLRGLTEEECRTIAKNEGLAFGERVAWVWQDGIIPKAMRHGNGRGAWLYLDELGAAEPQVLVKINRIFEQWGRLELAENGNRFVEAGPEFRIAASTNPPEYAGRQPFAPDFLRRWVYQKIGTLTPEVLRARLAFRSRGRRPELPALIRSLGLVETTPLDYDAEPAITEALEALLTEFFTQARKAVADGTIGKDQRQKFRYEATDCYRMQDSIAAFGGADVRAAFEQAVQLYFAGKLGKPEDRTKLMQMLTTAATALKTWEKVATARRPTPERPPETAEERTARETAEAALRALRAAERRGEFTGPFAERVESLRSSLESTLNTRLAAAMPTELRGTSEEAAWRLTLSTPDLPPSLTPEHLAAIQEAFPGSEPIILPPLSDLQDLAPDSPYVRMMYPEAQRPEDTDAGLTSHRASWWGRAAEIEGSTFRTITEPDPDHPGATRERPETWGEVYLRSMAAELQSIAPNGAIVLLDTTIKPKYTDGEQQYGTAEGVDASQDPLLPLFQEAFQALDDAETPPRPEATRNRFNRTWNDLVTHLLPLVQRRIEEAFRARGLTLPPDCDLTIQLTPASLANLAMTTTPGGRASSQTNTWEWTSTPLLDTAGNDTGRRLVVGDSGYGGAAHVGRGGRSGRDDLGGARLAVVLRKKRD